MEEYNGPFYRCEVEPSPVENLNFRQNQCLSNAYKVAERTGAMIVEGLLRISNVKFVVHAWNKLDNVYFDPTKDYIFETEEFRTEMHERGIDTLTYEYVRCVEYNITDCNRDEEGNILFRYSYNMLLEVANSHPGNNNINDAEMQSGPDGECRCGGDSNVSDTL